MSRPEMTAVPLSSSPVLAMAAARPPGTLGSSGSTNRHPDWSHLMHPTLVQELTRQRMDALDHEADRRRLAASVRSAATDRARPLDRLARIGGRFRLALRGSAA